MRHEPRDRVEFDGVEVVSADDLILMCRIAGRLVAIPARRTLRGTAIARAGDRGRLVLGRELALNLGLI